MKLPVLICSIILSAFGLIAQNEETKLMQQALDLPSFNQHVEKQRLIDRETVMVYFVEDQPKSVFTLSLFNQRLNPFVAGNEESIDKVHVNFTKVSVQKNKAHIVYYFLPNWNICDENGPSPTYSTGLFLVVDVKYKKVDGQWVIASTKLKDIRFKPLEHLPGYGCLKFKYIPLEQK